VIRTAAIVVATLMSPWLTSRAEAACSDAIQCAPDTTFACRSPASKLDASIYISAKLRMAFLRFRDNFKQNNDIPQAIAPRMKNVTFITWAGNTASGTVRLNSEDGTVTLNNWGPGPSFIHCTRMPGRHLGD